MEGDQLAGTVQRFDDGFSTHMMRSTREEPDQIISMYTPSSLSNTPHPLAGLFPLLMNYSSPGLSFLEVRAGGERRRRRWWWW